MCGWTHTVCLPSAIFNAAVCRCAAAAVRLRSWIYTVYTHCTHTRGLKSVLIFIHCLLTPYTHEGLDTRPSAAMTEQIRAVCNFVAWCPQVLGKQYE